MGKSSCIFPNDEIKTRGTQQYRDLGNSTITSVFMRCHVIITFWFGWIVCQWAAVNVESNEF